MQLVSRIGHEVVVEVAVVVAKRNFIILVPNVHEYKHLLMDMDKNG